MLESQLCYQNLTAALIISALPTSARFWPNSHSGFLGPESRTSIHIAGSIRRGRRNIFWHNIVITFSVYLQLKRTGKIL